MTQTRRKFLKSSAIASGVGVGSSVLFLSTSKRRAGRLFRKLVADTRRKIEPASAKPDPARWDDNQITLAWLGHSTVLINFYGIKILTDPALGSRVGVSLGIGTIGPKRYIAPALRGTELPAIDVVLLSHAHMDHMDLPSLGSLRGQPLVITAKDTSDILSGTGLKNLTELPWNEKTQFHKTHETLEIEAFEVNHWGERWPSDKQRGYNGYVLKRNGKSILFAGDTAKTALFRNLKTRGPFAIGIMPIGAYDPWIWNHCTPEQALEMADAAGAEYLLPVHHKTFQLSNEPMNEPIERFTQALGTESKRLCLSGPGETFVWRG
jgi:L-ascorbate metabolism protein UlaG (beta-lactamase superfamily)